MYLAEPIERINETLKNLFGIDTVSGEVIWRVVWSEDQFEKRRMNVTDAGIHLLSPEIREVPKYRQWIQEKYVLERLTAVPEFQQDEIGVKISYEPIWVFEDNKGNYLPPRIDACKLVIDTIHAATGDGGVATTEPKRGSMRKYVDEMANASPEQVQSRIDGLVEQLWGNDNDTHLALRLKEGVTVPTNYGDNDK